MVDKIKVFASDDNLKSLGELLSNDSSRNIIFHLMNNEMYTNEISTKLEMRVSLVIHHLKKMEDLGLLEISEKQIIKKGQKHRFFKIKSDIFITINKSKEEIKEKRFLSRIFRDEIKFTVIGVASFISWLLTPNKTTQTFTVLTDNNMPDLTVPFLVIIIGFILILIKKKRG